MQLYYWHQPAANSFGRQPLRHAVSGEVIGQRPAAEGLRRLRSKVSGLIQVLAEARLTCSDAQSLVTVLRSCRDARVVIDVVKLLLSWLTPVAQIGAERSEPGAAPRLRLPSCGAALVARLAELARKSEETLYDTLVDLMHGDSELLRLAALRLLGLLLAAGGTALSPPPAIWPRITHAMGGTPSFSGTTYSALLDTMVGRPHAVTLDPSVLPSDTICNPQFIPTILQLLPRAAPPIQQTALSHLTRLCKARPSNCDAILQQTGVQRLLLLLLRAEAGEGGATGAASATAATAFALGSGLTVGANPISAIGVVTHHHVTAAHRLHHFRVKRAGDGRGHACPHSHSQKCGIDAIAVGQAKTHVRRAAGGIHLELFSQSSYQRHDLHARSVNRANGHDQWVHDDVAVGNAIICCPFNNLFGHGKTLVGVL